MHRQSGESSAQSSDAGWAELTAGRWLTARDAFRGVLEVEETPEALEGLSWSAWWLDDAEGVFAAREGAFRLYRKRGDDRSAARMATWLAVDELDFRGALAVASGWLRRARRLLGRLEPGPDHGWLAFHEGYVASIKGETAVSLRRAREAAELGRRFEVADLEMLGLALEGAVLVGGAEVEEGMACLDEAAAMALVGEAAVPISAAWTWCFLVSACEAVRDYPRAYEWCDRIAEFAGRHGSRYMLGFCRSHYGLVHVWRGRWAEAESELEAAVEAYARSRPPFVSEPLVALAELRRRQGRWQEAERLLDRAGTGSGLLVRAGLAMDRGKARRAAELAERVLRGLPPDRRLQRGPALEVLIRALARQGEKAGAEEALEELRALVGVVATGPLEAALRLAEGTLAAAAGDHERARRRLEDAVDGYERCALPFEAARARLELAASLTALGRGEAARREAAAAREALGRLGVSPEAWTEQRPPGGADGAGTGETALTALTRREREVLCRVAEGLTNRQIAERLFVSEHTVHRHVTNILRKLELPSRTAAAAVAARSGLTSPGA